MIKINNQINWSEEEALWEKNLISLSIKSKKLTNLSNKKFFKKNIHLMKKIELLMNKDLRILFKDLRWIKP